MRRRCKICGGEAKLMKIIEWEGYPAEHHFRCVENPDHDFIIKGYIRIYKPRQSKPTIFFPTSFSGAAQWVEN